jgi:hypothetical protein
MTERHELEASLLAEISRRGKEISETQHELARQQRVLSRAATLLRLGKGAPTVPGPAAGILRPSPHAGAASGAPARPPRSGLGLIAPSRTADPSLRPRA